MGRKVLLNGNQIDYLTISPDSPSIHYGKGFFETLLYENSKLYFFEQHLERLRVTLKLFKVHTHKGSLTKKNIYDFIDSLGLSDSTLRVKISVLPLTSLKTWDILITLHDYDRNISQCSAAVHYEICDSFLDNFKSCNYHYNLYWKDFYKNLYGTDEVLFLNTEEKIIEGSYSNVILVKDNVVSYVNAANKYLKGIIQDYIITNYKSLGFSGVDSQNHGFSIDELRDCDEVILTNSLIIARSVNTILYKTSNTGTRKINAGIRLKGSNYSRLIREAILDK